MSTELCQVSSDIFQTCVSVCRNNRYKQPIKMVASQILLILHILSMQ